MAEDSMPLFPKADNFFIHAGNICSWDRLKKKINQSPDVEVRECLTSCMKNCYKQLNSTEAQYITSVDCSSKEPEERVSDYEGDREDLKVTVKVFLTNTEPSALEDAISHVMKTLDLTYIDSILVAFPPETSEEVRHNGWTALEQAYSSEEVLAIGICDMDKTELEELYNWAQVKPTTNQVNLASCCVMPAALTEFAKENEIQLLTHNDPPVVLNSESFGQMISETFTPRDADGWQLQWLIRYTSLIRCRGIIKSKGYVVRALRDVRGKRAL